MNRLASILIILLGYSTSPGALPTVEDPEPDCPEECSLYAFGTAPDGPTLWLQIGTAGPTSGHAEYFCVACPDDPCKVGFLILYIGSGDWEIETGSIQGRGSGTYSGIIRTETECDGDPEEITLTDENGKQLLLSLNCYC